MGVPVMLATAAACGSLVTTMKSGWELSRMVRQKLDEQQAEEDSVRVYRNLRRALHSGRMSEREYDHWYEKFLVAESEKNLSGLRKIRAHLRIIYDNAPYERRYRHRSGQAYRRSDNRHSDDRRSDERRSDTRSDNRRSDERRSDKKRYDYEDDKRQKSVRFDRRPQIFYAPDPPQRHEDLEWPQSAGSIEYFPLKGNDEPAVIRLARLQRSASVSYSPSDRSSDTYVKRRTETTRYEKERGRSRSRETVESRGDPDLYAHPSDDFYHEKLGYRSKR